MAHAGKKPKKGEGDEDEDDEEEEEGSEEPADEAVTEQSEEPAETEPAESEPSPAAADCYTEKAPEEEEIEAQELPREYRTPAELMRTIYLIQKRDIPAKTDTIDKAEDAAS